MQQPQPTNLGAYTGAGMTFVVAVLVFALGGFWLDQKLGTTPLFLLVGFGVGAFGGFIHLASVVAPDILPFAKKSKKSKTSDPDEDQD